uniref:Odorant-binding protein OBP46 n=1 Tax=Lobesia botrana TaxID=209534 RepID=A0A345BER9_9NEOP|nr:odorant-binding protein OBP46 [Lobesia botrana]
MDQYGRLAVEEMRKKIATTFAGNPEQIKNGEDFINFCKYVNDEYITGYNKECQRAVLIFNCSIHSPYEWNA